MSENFGTITWKGEEITLDEQAYLTGRVLDEYSQELQYQGDGDTYMDEWQASGHTASGEEVEVVWHFEITRYGKEAKNGAYDAETLPEDYDWDDVYNVRR